MAYTLITGASKGIGKAMAIEVAKLNRDLILIARSEIDLKDLSTQLFTDYQIKTVFLSIDLSAPDAAKKVFDWVKAQQLEVDVLINNAGYGLSGFFESSSLDDILNMMHLNMQTLIQLTHLFLPELKKQKSAYILNIASTAAYQAVPGLSVYAATKSFVKSFSRALHQELSNTNVSVSCISPGPTDTNFVTRAKLGAKGLAAAEKANMQPDEVAKIAINALFNRKTETVTGFLNKLGVLMAWLLPKNLVEKTIKKIYT